MKFLVGLLGILIILGIAYLLSYNRKAINIRTIIGAFAIQVFFAFFVLYIPLGQTILGGMASGISTAISAGNQGIEFVFGDLAKFKLGFIFAVNVLAIVIFFSSLISVLYYIKIMPLIINTLGLALHKFLKTSRPESLSATANIFVGQTEAPLVIRPFLKTMTKSEIFAVMVGGLASVAGGVLVGYAALGIDIKFLIAASFMAAPAGLLMAKIIMPETETPIQTMKEVEEENKPTNIIEAAADGASAGLKLVLNIAAMLIAFIGLISLADFILGGITNMLLGYTVTIAQILGFVFAPIALIIGIPLSEAVEAGSLIGQKIIFNEFVAYLSFSQMLDSFSPHSQAIITFALCGFANISSIGILLGGLGVLVPEKRKIIAQFAVKAIIAGSLANFLNAAIAGMILSI